MAARILAKLVASVRWLSYLAFWAGLCVEIYSRYNLQPDSHWLVTTAVISAAGVAVCALLAWRDNGSRLLILGELVIAFNPSFLLGCLTFSKCEGVDQDYYETIATSLLLISLIIYVAWIASMCGMVTFTSPTSIHSTELFALIGLFSAAVFCSDRNLVGIFCSIMYIALTIFALHRKTLFVLILLPLYIILNVKTILGDISLVNKEMLCVFLLILIIQPLASTIVSSETPLKSWEKFIGTQLTILKMATLLIMCVEMLLLVLVATSLKAHKEWLLIIPLYGATAVLLWLPLHIVYFLVSWKLWGRMRKSIDILNTDPSRSFAHVLSSRGLRHFGLISYPLMWCNLAVTTLQFVFSWTTQNSITCGLLLVCLPTQIILIGLLRILACRLGGTCCAYALVTPNILRSDDDTNVREVQTSSSYATRTIRLIQDFVTHHLLADGGCEYLSDRMTEASLKYKLDGFFNMKTSVGDNFDSYLLYYSGPVTDAGDWILKGDGVLTYKKLITWWTDLDVSKSSRLILVLDTTRSNYWVSHVRRTTIACVAIQTLYVRKESEVLQEFSVGDFTRDWVDFNCNRDSEIYTDSFRSPIVATYGISPYWPSFRFHEPSSEEMNKHWQENFSFQLKPLVFMYSLLDRQQLCCICTRLSHCLSILRMWIWSPNQLDIGHGFKLVRFFKVASSADVL